MIYKWLYPKRWARKRRNALLIEKAGLERYIKFELPPTMKLTTTGVDNVREKMVRVGEIEEEVRQLDEQWLS